MLKPLMYLLLVIASVDANKTEDCSSFKALETLSPWNDYNMLIQSEMQFTADLFRKIGVRRSADNLNTAFTPTNIYNALLVMYVISANRTEELIREMFHIPQNKTKSSIHAIYNTLTLHKRTSIALKLKGNKELQPGPQMKEKVQHINEDFCIFLSNKLKVKNCALTLFNRNIKMVDFTKPEEAVHTMKEWVTNQTGHDAEPLQQLSFNKYTHMMFANTALFHGVWKHKFTSLKKNQEFQMQNGTKMNVTLMVSTGEFKIWYDDDLKVDILEIPYEGDIYRVLVLLPRYPSSTAISHLLTSLSKQKLEDIMTNRTNIKESNVTIEIPKFTFQKTYDLVKTMKYLGFKRFFDVPIDLSSILEQSENSKIMNSRVKAAYTVEVKFDEFTKHSSSNVTSSSFKRIENQENTRQTNKVFRADHPFVYCIYTATNLIALGGILYHP